MNKGSTHAEPKSKAEKMGELEERIEFGTSKQMPTELADFEEAKGSILRRLNVACGKTPLAEGWEGMDIEPDSTATIQHDILQFPWPLEDGSIYEMECSHFIEHIPHDLHNGNRKDGFIQFFEEVYRVLMPEGLIRISAPYYTSVRAFQDPTHCRYISEITFNYLNRDAMKAGAVDHYMGDFNFELLTRQYVLANEYLHRAEEARVWAMKHQWNVVDDIVVLLRKK